MTEYSAKYEYSIKFTTGDKVTFTADELSRTATEFLFYEGGAPNEELIVVTPVANVLMLRQTKLYTE